MVKKQIKKEDQVVTVSYIYKVNHTLYFVAQDLSELERLVEVPIKSVEIYATIESDGRVIFPNSEPIKIVPPAIPQKKPRPYFPDGDDNKPWVSPPYGGKNPNFMYMTKNDHERTTHISPPVSSFEYWCRMDNKGD
jgi:hypothetical protein